MNEQKATSVYCTEDAPIFRNYGSEVTTSSIEANQHPTLDLLFCFCLRFIGSATAAVYSKRVNFSHVGLLCSWLPIRVPFSRFNTRASNHFASVSGFLRSNFDHAFCPQWLRHPVYLTSFLALPLPLPVCCWRRQRLPDRSCFSSSLDFPLHPICRHAAATLHFTLLCPLLRQQRWSCIAHLDDQRTLKEG